MTAPAETGTAGSVNGAAAAAAADIADVIPVSERVMGVVGLLFAVGIAAVAIDLMTGGWLSALFAGGSGDDAG
jgi:hypothetical protein